MPPSSEGTDVFGLGPYLRAQRRLARLSLRQMAQLAGVSNPYLSQVERGLHEPSVRILRSIAEALNLSAETVLEQAGLLSGAGSAPTGTETAIRHDTGLTEEQKLALLSVYRSYRSANGEAEPGDDPGSWPHEDEEDDPPAAAGSVKGRSSSSSPRSSANGGRSAQRAKSTGRPGRASRS